MNENVLCRRHSSEKTQKHITSNHKMPMSTNSVNYCVYNKPTYIEQAIVLPLIQTFLCTNPPRRKTMKNSEYKRGLTIIQLVLRASHHLQKKRTRFYRVLFLFRGLCAAMPCRLRREPLRAGAAFMRVNSLTSLLRKHCLLRSLISTTDKKDEPDHCRVLFLFYCRNRVRLPKERGKVKH